MSTGVTTLPRIVPQDSVKSVILNYPFGETISALRMVYIKNGLLYKGSPSLTLTEASVLGILLNGGGVGSIGRVLAFGTLGDASFAGLSSNLPLFMQADGSIGNGDPSLQGFQYQVNIGKSFGSNLIYINVMEPIKL